MIGTRRARLAVAAGAAVAVAGVIGLSGASAGAEPTPVIPGLPTITQTVTPAAGVSAPMAVAPTVPPGAALPWQPTALAGSPVAAAPTPTLVPATSGTLSDFLKGRGVKLEPQKAQGFKALNITLPMPAGWSQVPDPNVPDAFLVIANRSSADLYTPNAALVVYKLVGDFDPREAITHGLIDTQMLPAWQATGASLNDFLGMPSAAIEGTYRSADLTLNTSRRHVLVQSGPDRYLVSLSVTTTATSQGVSDAAAAADAVVNGFRVAPGTP
jgi:Probable lipoprotein LpqN